MKKPIPINVKASMLSIILKFIYGTNKIIVKGSLNRFRDLIYVDDVVDIWIEAINNKKFNNRIINLGTGKKIKVNQIIDVLKSLHNKKAKIEISRGTPGDQYGIYSDKSIFNISNKKKFINMKEGFKKFYLWAKKTDF